MSQPQPSPASPQGTAHERSAEELLLEQELKISFWRRPWVQQVVPLATSLLFHLGIIVLAVVVIRTLPKLIEVVVQEQVIIPEGMLADSTDLGPMEQAGLNDDPTRPSMQDQDPTVNDTQGWAEREGQNQTPSNDSDTSAESTSNVTPIGVGVRTGGALTNSTRIGSGEGGGRLARFGPPGGGKRGIFAPGGRGGNARNIIYICDASGSIGSSATRKAVLINELKKAIDNLKPIQFFNVIFFADERPKVLNDSGLLAATPANKQRAYAYLDSLQMQGQTDPVPALQVAFKQKPELVFLLTDGEFFGSSTPEDVIAAVKNLNRDGKVPINTIMLDNDREEEHKTLRTIAELTGGRFTSVSAEELLR